MKNLAGHPQATALCARELQVAGIDIVPIEPTNEVPSSVGGQLGEFKFWRGWRYWVVEGPMPLDVARALYADPLGYRDVRAAGDGVRRPPEQWVEWSVPDGRTVVADPTGRQAAAWADYVSRHPDQDDRPIFVSDPPTVPEARGFITHYHVDSEEGLRLLVDTIKALPSEVNRPLERDHTTRQG